MDTVPAMETGDPVRLLRWEGYADYKVRLKLPPLDWNPPLFIVKALPLRVGIFKQSMGARNRVRIGLSDRPARQHRLAELNPWNRLLDSLKVKKKSGSNCFSLFLRLFQHLPAGLYNPYCSLLLIYMFRAYLTVESPSLPAHLQDCTRSDGR